jgi:hypothetical protein
MSLGLITCGALNSTGMFDRNAVYFVRRFLGRTFDRFRVYLFRLLVGVVWFVHNCIANYLTRTAPSCANTAGQLFFTMPNGCFMLLLNRLDRIVEAVKKAKK